MGIMQLLNIILFWLFFGLLTSHLAKKRGRHPLIWFFVGIFLGILGVLLVILLPKNRPRRDFPLPPLKKIYLPERSETWLKMWYYLDPTHEQQGPFEFPDFVKNWRQQQITENSLIWGEGMKEWKRLSELPDLLKEMDKV